MRIAVISRYPLRNETHSNTSGIASYTKNLIYSLKDLCDIYVLADKKSRGEIYDEDNNIHVITCWSDIFFPLEIILAMRKLKGKIDVIHVQYDTFLYGNMSIISFPFFITLLKFFRIPIVITMHSALSLRSINKKFLCENGIGGHPFILKTGYYLVTKIILRSTKKVIVHDEKFRDIYIEDYNVDNKKICTIRHGVEVPKEIYEKYDARDMLGIDKSKNVILYFGYIIGYKGIDNLIDAFGYLDDNKYVLIIAGGEHPRTKNGHEIDKLKKKASNISNNIIFPGFISENKIPLYFSSVDVVVLPYIKVMASSGPLSLAIAYEKPLLVSDAFKHVISLEDMIFKNEPKDIAEKIELFFRDDKVRHNISEYSKNLKLERNWNEISKKVLSLYSSVEK